MRKQPRPPIPQVLVLHGARWTQQWLELRRTNPSAQFQWYAVGGESARELLLPHLKAMTQGHCAFCDTFPLDDRTKESIEHFKPKSDARFAEHAYTWENLYYCCSHCQGDKGSRWDDELLRPDEDSYRFEDYFEFDYTNGSMTPSEAQGDDVARRARVTIGMYALDSIERRRGRQLELRKWRKSTDRAIDEWSYRDYLEKDGPGVLEVS